MWCALLVVLLRCPLVCGCSGVVFAVMCVGSGPSVLGWLSPLYQFRLVFLLNGEVELLLLALDKRRPEF